MREEGSGGAWGGVRWAGRGGGGGGTCGGDGEKGGPNHREGAVAGVEREAEAEAVDREAAESGRKESSSDAAALADVAAAARSRAERSVTT